MQSAEDADKNQQEKEEAESGEMQLQQQQMRQPNSGRSLGGASDQFDSIFMDEQIEGSDLNHIYEENG